MEEEFNEFGDALIKLVTDFIRRLRANSDHAEQLKFTVCNLSTLKNEEARALADWMDRALESESKPAIYGVNIASLSEALRTAMLRAAKAPDGTLDYPEIAGYIFDALGQPAPKPPPLYAAKVLPLLWKQDHDIRGDVILARAKGVGGEYELAKSLETGDWFWSFPGEKTIHIDGPTSGIEISNAHHRQNVLALISVENGAPLESEAAEDMRAVCTAFVDELVHVAKHSPFWSEYQRVYINQLKEQIAGANPYDLAAPVPDEEDD